MRFKKYKPHGFLKITQTHPNQIQFFTIFDLTYNFLMGWFDFEHP